MRADRPVGPLATIALAVVLTGCLAVPGAIDGPIVVDMHISTTSTSVDVDAPGWFADVSAIYLCPSLPPPLPDAAANRIGWAPGGDCHDYGTRPSRDGLTVSLPLADLDAPQRVAFDASPEWYLLLLDLDGDRVSSAVRSAFGAPR